MSNRPGYGGERILGYKNDKLKRDTETVEKFVESITFIKLIESLDEQDRAATEDAEQFLRECINYETNTI